MGSETMITHIGKYEVLGILGVGGMGVVYRGMDRSVGREVAIKTLSDATPELRQRFHLEARSGILDHQNIVTVYDFGEQDGNPYIVMECVPGDSLDNLLRAGQNFSLIDKLEIMQQVCTALGYAHSKGVIHRDIKPANIMVQPNGEVKIVDFGIARLTHLSGHTETGSVIGTFDFISPERLLGKPFDGRADIWSAGVILYLLLTRRLPFADDETMAPQSVISHPFEPVSTFTTDYPPALDTVLDRALAKQPADRYETAEEMAADIELVNEGLKNVHVAETLEQIKVYLTDGQFPLVKQTLVHLQRMSPQNIQVKSLLREVQVKILHQQRSETFKQLVKAAEEAVLLEHYAEAIRAYEQAEQLEPSQPGLAEKLAHVRGLKQTANRVAELLQQSQEARERGDFEKARELIEQGVQLDGRNTSLRNERARIIHEAQETLRQQYSRAGCEQLQSGELREAIKNLHAALQIDPTDGAVQRMYEDAVEQQEAARRRKIVEQIVTEIESYIFCEDFDRAITLIRRAQEKLPGEAILLELKTEAETKQQEVKTRKLVEEASLKAYSLFLIDPEKALKFVRQALDQVPGEPQLVALEARVLEQWDKVNLELRKGEFLKQAQLLIDAQNFIQAVDVLDKAAAECGSSPDISFLMTYAQEQKGKGQLKLTASQALKEAQTLVAGGYLEAAIERLQLVSKQASEPAVEQMIRQSTAALEDQSRRVDNVIHRARSLNEQDSAKAIQFLADQPSEIQQHARIHEVRISLEDAVERDKRTVQAVKLAIETLQRRDLRSGLNALEAVRTACGDSPRLAAAIAQFQKKREQIANELVTAAVQASRQALVEQDREGAIKALSAVADSVEFADAPQRDEWNRQNSVCSNSLKPVEKIKAAIAAGEEAALPKAPNRVIHPKPSMGVGLRLKFGLTAAGVVLLLALTGVLIGKRSKRSSPKSVPVATGSLQVNATPFAEVLTVTARDGRSIALPANGATPLRLDNLVAGSYAVMVKGPAGNSQQPCTVSSAVQTCNFALQPIGDAELDEMVGGAK